MGITLVTCGGTISMEAGDDDVRHPSDSETVAHMCSAISGGHVDLLKAVNLDSSQATPDDWNVILRTVRLAIHDHPDQPVIVTHGTDTLAWTAAMLAAAGPWPVPVVITGANIPAGIDGSDAMENLSASIAACTVLPDGVFAVFAGEPDTPATIYQGGYFRKLHAGRAAFQSLVPLVGKVTKGQVDGLPDPIEPSFTGVATNATVEAKRRVVLVNSSPVAAHLLPVSEPRPDVLIVEMYACATAPAGCVEMVADATARGIVTWACPTAPLSPEDAAYESLTQMRAAGAQVSLTMAAELMVSVAYLAEDPSSVRFE